MLREMIEKETTVVKEALHTVREWIHPTTVMKSVESDRPLDDLGQPLDDVEQQAAAAARRDETARAP